MPAQFKKSGVSFLYPENWTLDEDDAPDGHLSVTVYSPGGGFWSVARYPDPADPLKLTNAAVEAMKQEYQSVEVEEVHETIADRKMIGFDFNFFLLDFTNTAQIRSFKFNKAVYTIFCQAEDHDFEQNQQVFLAMTVSLLNGLKDLSYWD
jgi:hypothetical protein